MSALVLHDVRKTYASGHTEIVALDDANLTVAGDEIVALVGPSGSGKTTLLSIAGGLLTPTAGSVVVGGEDISEYGPRQLTAFRGTNIGFVFQSVNLVPFLNAEENPGRGRGHERSGPAARSSTGPAAARGARTVGAAPQPPRSTVGG